MSTPLPDPSGGDGSAPRPRRKRYRGTHPRRFDEKYKELNPRAHPEIVEHVRAQGRTPAGMHVPILLQEALAALAPQPGHTVVDCTLGYGGHAAALIERISPGGRFIGLDVDGAELPQAETRLRGLPVAADVELTFVRSNFAGLPGVLARLGAVDADGGDAPAAAGLMQADAILADLGVSSMQLDNPARGFSYKAGGPLDLRLDDRVKQTAADWLARLPQKELVRIFEQYADEPLAEEIVRTRAAAPLQTAPQLLRLIDRVRREAGASREELRDRSTAARVFQALRIHVNDELGALRNLLRVLPDCLRPGGRVGILTFHSGEDRLVKHAFRDGRAAGIYSQIAEEPVRPGREEVRSNPRSASAKLRWAVRAATA
jgi:16S rRNA (cytosine1402-N4)-methyltransferase